ncbi:MAG: hypothetical protein WKF78_12035 [Candidatus Limnocylindrales bacterium]
MAIAKDRLVSSRTRPYSRPRTVLTVIASLSGCQADSKTVNVVYRTKTAIVGQGAISAATATAPPTAQICSVLGRPRRTSARWPQTGTAIVNPIAPMDAISPISPALNPRSRRMTETNG